MLLQGLGLELGFGQLAAHLFLVLLAVLLQLEPGFEDALLHSPAFPGVLRQFLLHLGQLALIFQQAIARDVAVVRQRLQVAQLLAQGFGLATEVGAGPAHAGQLRGGAFDIGTDARLLPGECLAPAAEQLALALQHQGQARIVAVAQGRGEIHLLEVVALAAPARQAGHGHAVLGLQRLHVRRHLGLVQAKQRLALLHAFALAHQDPG